MSDTEKLNIFDEHYQKIGQATRNEAHQKGLWHETFHCWFYYIHHHEVFLYFQKRAASKKDFPNQFDITAAGHLLESETIADGFREVKEELNIDVRNEDAISLGMFPVVIETPLIVDKEFTHVFLVEKKLDSASFYLQESEVSGLYVLSLDELKELLKNPEKKLFIKGIQQKSAKKTNVTEQITKKELCASDESYYWQLIDYFEKMLKNKKTTID